MKESWHERLLHGLIIGLTLVTMCLVLGGILVGAVALSLAGHPVWAVGGGLVGVAILFGLVSVWMESA